MTKTPPEDAPRTEIVHGADNFVSLLHTIGKRLKNEDRATSQVLADALEVEIRSTDFHDAFVRFAELPSLAREQAAALLDGPTRERYLSDLGYLADTLPGLDLNAGWRQTYAPQLFTVQRLTALELCAIEVQAKLTKALPTEDTVAELLQQIQEAIEAVVGAEDLEIEARLLLLDMLNEVANALRSYRISGVAGVRRAAERTVGGMLLSGRAIREQEKSPVVVRAMTALWRVTQAVTTLASLKELPEAVQGFLMLPPTQ